MPVMSFVWIFVFLVAGNAVSVLGKGPTAGKPEMHSEVGEDIFLPHSYYVKLQKKKNHNNGAALRAMEVAYLNVNGSIEIADVIPDDRRGIRISSQGVAKTNGKSIRKHNITRLKHEQGQKTYYPLETDEWSPTIRDAVKSAASNDRNTLQADKEGRNNHNHKRPVTKLARTKRSTRSKLMSPTSRHTPIRSYRKIKRSKSERKPRSNRSGNSKATYKRGINRKLGQNVNFSRKRSTIVAKSSKSKTRRPAEGSAFRLKSKSNSSRRRNIKKLKKKRTGAKRSRTRVVHGGQGEIKKHNNTQDDDSGKRKDKVLKKDVPLQRKLDEKKLNNTTVGKGGNNATGKEAPLQNKTSGKILNNTAVDQSSNNESKKNAPLQGKVNGKKLNNTVIDNNSNNASNKKNPLPRKPDEKNNAIKKAASLQKKTDEKKLNTTTIDNSSDNKSEATKTQNETKSGYRIPPKVKINNNDWQDLDKIDSEDRQKSSEDVVGNTTVDNSLAKNKTTKQKHTQEYSADSLKSNSSNTSDLKAHESNLTTEDNVKHKSKLRPGARRSGFAGVYDARNSIITKKFGDLKKSNSTKPISNRQDIKTKNKQKQNNNVLKPADRKNGAIENHESVKLAAKRLGTEGAHGNNVVTTKSGSKKINKLDRQTSGKDGVLDFRTSKRNSVRRKGSKTKRKHRPNSNNALKFRTNSYNSVSKKRTRNKSGRNAGARSLTRTNAGIKNKRITKGHHKLGRKSTINFRTANSNSLNSKDIKNRNIRHQGVKAVKKENIKNERTEKKGPKKQVSFNSSGSGDHKSVNVKHSDPKSANETNSKYDSSLHKSGSSVKHQQDPFQSKADKSVKKHTLHSNMVSEGIHAKDNQPLEPKNSGKLIPHRPSSRTPQGKGSRKPSQRSQNIKLVNKSIKSRGQDTKTKRRDRAKTLSKPKRAKAKKGKDDGVSERAFPTINKNEGRESASTQILNGGLELYREPALYKVEHVNRSNLSEPNNLKDNQYSNTINERKQGNDLPCPLQKLNSVSGEKSAQNCDESNLPNRQDLNISHEVPLKTSAPFPKALKDSFIEKVSDMEHGKSTTINLQKGTEYKVSNITKTSHSPRGEGQQQVNETIINTESKSYSILQIAFVDPIPKEYLKMVLG